VTLLTPQRSFQFRSCSNIDISPLPMDQSKRMPVRAAKIYWWLLIVPSMSLLLYATIKDPFVFGRFCYITLHYSTFGFITLDNFQMALNLISVGAFAAHFIEALVGLKWLSNSKRKVGLYDTLIWFSSIVLLGGPQLSMLNKGLATLNRQSRKTR